MDKFNSQQDALRTALAQVMGSPQQKGSLVISDEQRAEVGKLMMAWLAEGRWSIRPGTRAFSNPLNYIVGKQPTCLIEAWVQPKQSKQNGASTGGGANEKFNLIKMALEAGIISKEEASKQFSELLGAK